MQAVSTRPTVSMEDRPDDGVFEVRRGSLAEDLGRRLRARGPVKTGLAVWGSAFVLLTVLIAGLGLLLTQVILPGGLGSVDRDVSWWFVGQRTPTLNSVTLVASEFGSTGAIVGVALVAVVVLVITKHRYQLAFVIGALSLEFAVFLTTVFLIDRDRPPVPRLDPSPVTSSYPSGHAAASLTLYLAIAIAVTSLVRSAIARTIVWAVAVAVPAAVAISRVYRGMHHLTDVSASVLLACGALLFALLATRSAMAASLPSDDEAAAQPPAAFDLEEAS